MGIIDYIDVAIPAGLKRATSAGIGLFIALIGLANAKVIISDPDTLVALGNLQEPETLLAVIGLLIIAVLVSLRVRGGILVGILLTTVVSFFMGITPFPTSFSDIVGMPAGLGPIAFHLDLAWAFQMGFMTIFAFLFVDIFDTITLL